MYFSLFFIWGFTDIPSQTCICNPFLSLDLEMILRSSYHAKNNMSNSELSKDREHKSFPQPIVSPMPRTVTGT